MSIHDLSNLLICPEDLKNIIDEKSDSYIFTKNLFVSSMCLGKTKDSVFPSYEYVDCFQNNSNDEGLSLEIDKEVYSTITRKPISKEFIDFFYSEFESYDLSQQLKMKKECYDIASKAKKDMYMYDDNIIERIKPYDLCDKLF